MSKNNLPNFSIKQLLEAGVHFGHKTMRRNPKTSKYIFGSRNKLSIINLEETAKHLYAALKVVKEVAKNNGRILFVSTKKQGFDAVEEAAKRSGQYYVNTRWLGGMLTNWKTISQSIKTLKKIEDQLAKDNLGLNKKERLVLDRKREKLENALGGIRNMGGYPDLIFVIDINRESLAIAEAKKLGLPIMAIVDTNCNPEGITFPIPGNDDSVKAIKLYCHLISDAILAGISENVSMAGSVEDKKGKDKKITKKVEEKKPEEKKTEEKKSDTKKKTPAVKKATTKATEDKAKKSDDGVKAKEITIKEEKSEKAKPKVKKS